MDSKLKSDILAKTYKMRQDSLRMSVAAGASGAHLGGGLSMMEIMSVLYLGIMNINPKKLDAEDRDRFILSKGHGTLALYTAMNQAGIIPDDELLTFKSNDTFLTGHPIMNVQRGIEFSSGSLGQGLSLGVGTCLALNRKGNDKSRVFVLLGDGECDEGSVWEAAMPGAHYKLSNHVAIIDKNGLQYDGATDSVLSLENLADKWRAFGWNAVDVDGHDIEKLYDVLSEKHEKPLAVIAHTVKGKGVSFMENNPVWHHAVLSKDKCEEAFSDLEKNYAGI